VSYVYNKIVINRRPYEIKPSWLTFRDYFVFHVLCSLAHTIPHWSRVVAYGPFLLFVINKKGLCSSSGGINRLIMMIILCYILVLYKANTLPYKGKNQKFGALLLDLYLFERRRRKIHTYLQTTHALLPKE
jgi:hypothetical protein